MIRSERRKLLRSPVEIPVVSWDRFQLPRLIQSQGAQPGSSPISSAIMPASLRAAVPHMERPLTARCRPGAPYAVLDPVETLVDQFETSIDLLELPVHLVEPFAGTAGESGKCMGQLDQLPC